MLIHRVMKRRTMEPLGDRALPQSNIQENVHKASLTAARQKVSEGVWFVIAHSLKEEAMWWLNAETKSSYCHLKEMRQVTLTQT